MAEGEQLVVIKRFAAVAGHGHGVLPVNQLAQVLLERLFTQQIAHTQSLFVRAVGVRGRDAALRGAVAALAQALLFEFIFHGRDGKHHDRAIGNAQIFRRDDDAARAQRVHLVNQVLDVHHAARAKQIHLVRMKNTGRNEVQLELALIGHNGMAGVVSALIPHNGSILRHEIIDHSAFPFVTPANPDDCAILHSSFSPFRKTTIYNKRCGFSCQEDCRERSRFF